MLTRSVCNRLACSPGWYRGIAEYFSADTQQGVVCVGERLRHSPNGPHLGCLHGPQKRTSHGSLNASRRPAQSPSPETGDWCGGKLTFTAHDVYVPSRKVVTACDGAEMEAEARTCQSLYPCCIACGCPLLVHLQASSTGSTPRVELVRLYVPLVERGAGAAASRCPWYHPLPKAAFTLWQQHAGTTEVSREVRHSRPLRAEVDKHGDVGEAELGALEKMGLSLPELILHGPEGRGSKISAAAPSAVTLDDVNGISM